ncbi:hypothetical protein TSUD_85400 [Trifolium subterraneum]|uniref:Legume lectin domain-containing protein n=1 Tax=Trifolium subterraneum TaxID=3900 RepID=A0A2Z6P279_TRISU|nr:hypothetical protein TSUD_85400 [Trifolium subterraneum]
MISAANVTWLADTKEGKLNEAWVSYNASSLNLSVLFTGYNNITSTTVDQRLSSIVDLRLYLPEFVTIGFSAATGSAIAVHTLNSWKFHSNLEGEEDNNKTNSQDPVARSPSFNTAPTKKKKAKTRLALELGVGGFVLIGVLDFDEGQIKCLMTVGLWCTHPDPNNRPSIRQATHVLNFEATLPNLPSSMPVPTYLEGS